LISRSRQDRDRRPGTGRSKISRRHKPAGTTCTKQTAMIKTIEFDRVTKFTGRNGYFNAKGLEIMTYEGSNNIMITPLTAKGGQAARCDIEIPKENIRELIYELEDMLKEHYRVKLTEPIDPATEQINGFLAWNGKVQTYTRGWAIKKAKRFNGTIEKVK